MPGVLQIQTDLKLNPTAIWSTNPNPEDVELWLPSRIPVEKRRAACMEGLPDMELKFRTAQCTSSLDGLRRTLRVKTRMVYFKNKNVRGQREGTRSRAIIDRVHKRAIRFVQKYRAARRAKLTLEGPGEWEAVYRELLNEDIRGFASGKAKKQPLRRGIWDDGYAPVDRESPEVSDGDTEIEESDPDLNDGTEAGPVRYKKRKRGTGETRKALSWIWQTIPFCQDDRTGDDDILRAEWARSRARVRRATEEVLLLREEMRRVLEFLEYKAVEWEIRAEARDSPDSATMEGIRACAVEQAALQRKLASAFRLLWKTPLASVDTLLEQIENPPDHEGTDEVEGSDDEPENAEE